MRVLNQGTPLGWVTSTKQSPHTSLSVLTMCLMDITNSTVSKMKCTLTQWVELSALVSIFQVHCCCNAQHHPIKSGLRKREGLEGAPARPWGAIVQVSLWNSLVLGF